MYISALNKRRFVCLIFVTEFTLRNIKFLNSKPIPFFFQNSRSVMIASKSSARLQADRAASETSMST